MSSEEELARYREGYLDRAWRKMRENPAVPVGALVTVGTIVGASVRLYQGNSRSFNIWLRARVVAHSLTVAAVAYGLYSIGTNNLEKEKRTKEDQEALENVVIREKLEFQERLRQAEQTDAAEKEMWAQKLQRRNESNGDSTPVPTSSSSSWYSKLGWTSKSSNDKTPPHTPEDKQ